MRYFAKTTLDDAELFIQFGKDAEQNPTGRVDYMPTVEEATGFDDLRELADALTWYQVPQAEIVTAP